ncbi:DUF6766 family protein [Nonomuraea angiospora]|uniref:DUF6766 family protein n=1 Tax=Nonomuraea angiospora TaxID=46172 RepID=UPI0033BFFE5E
MRWVKENSLALAFLVMFLLSLGGRAVAGLLQYNDLQRVEGAEPVSFTQYVTSSPFAVDVSENWQSELLAVLSMVVLSIYLRQRGSPESKPVGAAHAETGVEG